MRAPLLFAALAVPVVALRYVLKGWLDPLGVPTWAGSLLASTWVLLGVAVVVLFGRAGRGPTGSYWGAAVPFALLAAWCEALVVAGILLTDSTGADTYFCGPWERVRETFPTGREHALGHAKGFVPRTLLWLVLGAITYAIARRGRR